MKRMTFHFYKKAAFLLSMFVFISIITANTLAWHDFTQHKTNVFRGTVQEMEVTLHKYEKDMSGVIISRPVANAQFRLYQVMDDKTVDSIGNIYITDQNGKITIEKLNTGNYYFEEIDPGYGYTYDLDADNNEIKHYPFTITMEDASNGTLIEVEVYNRRLQGELEIRKTVLGTGADINHQFQFTVSFSDGGDYGYKLNGRDEEKSLEEGKLYLKHGEYAVFENLPVGVFYNVTETNVPDYFTQSKNNQGTIKLDERSIAEFINTFEDVMKKGSLGITKTVSGTGAETDREFEFQITFGEPGTYTYKINDGAEQSFINGGMIKLKDNQTAVFSDLPLGLSYIVTENSANEDGYTASVEHVSGMIVLPQTEVRFNNHKDELDKLPGLLAIRKTVSGSGSDINKVFKFNITFSEHGTYAYTINGNPAGSITQNGTIELKHNEAAVFSDIPAGVTYTVTEDDYSGEHYTSAIKEQSGTIPADYQADANFNNHYENPDKDMVKLTVMKKVEGIVPENDKDKEFWFIFLLNEGEPIRFALKAGESKSFTIPKGATYSIVEDDYFKENYIQSSIVNGMGSATEQETFVTVTNTYIGAVLVSIHGEKTWDLKGNTDVKLPDAITVYLKNGDAVVETKTVRPGPEGKWTYTFHAPKFDKKGNEILYTVAEEPLPDFISSVTGYNIKNTYNGSETTSLKVTKKWIGENTNQPDSITVQLYRNSIAYGEPISLSSENSWTYMWTELDASSIWTVDEPTVPEGYTKRVEVSSKGEVTIYNTKKETSDKADEKTINIQVKKTWVHGNNPVENRPSSITIMIKKRNYVAAQKVITAADHWSWSVELPKYEADGKTPAVYTVEEQNVPQYTATYNGYYIQNTFQSENYPRDSQENRIGDTAKTVDDSNIWSWIFIMMLSIFLLISIGYYRKY